MFIKQVLTTPCSGPSSLAPALLVCPLRSHSISYIKNAAKTELGVGVRHNFHNHMPPQSEAKEISEQSGSNSTNLDTSQLILSFFHHIKPRILPDSMDPLRLDPNRDVFRGWQFSLQQSTLSLSPFLATLITRIEAIPVDIIRHHHSNGC